jgi:hypothetical protein
LPRFCELGLYHDRFHVVCLHKKYDAQFFFRIPNENLPSKVLFSVEKTMPLQAKDDSYQIRVIVLMDSKEEKNKKY